MPLLDERNRTEGLRLAFENQVAYLRILRQANLRLFGGFLTMQLAISGWLLRYSPESVTVKLGFLVVDGALTACAIGWLWQNHLRQRNAVNDLGSIYRAFGFLESGAYLPDEPLLAPPTVRTSMYWYFAAILLVLVGVIVVLFAGRGTL